MQGRLGGQPHELPVCGVTDLDKHPIARGPLGPAQIVISWGMLNRLRLVLERDLNVPKSAAEPYVDAIRGYAELGPVGAGPQLTLGGTGVIALHDNEDAHVLETALAGRALVLVTSNFKDFISKDTYEIVQERHAIHTTPAHVFHIAHPYQMMNWLRVGQIPAPRALFHL